MTPEEMADMMAYMPPVVELIGGPYCGYVVTPHHDQQFDVHRQLGNPTVDVSPRLHRFEPSREEGSPYRPPTMVIVGGSSGTHVYEMESGRVWLWLCEAQEVDIGVA